jgi:hypothetical protein
MSIKRRLAMAAVAAAAATLMVGPTALAAPKTGITFSVTCPGLGTFDVVTTPNEAAFSPVFAVDANQVFIPYEVHGTATGFPGGPFTFDDIKPAPVPADAMTCTFEGTFTEDGITITLSGTALVALRGAPS